MAKKIMSAIKNPALISPKGCPGDYYKYPTLLPNIMSNRISLHMQLDDHTMTELYSKIINVGHAITGYPNYAKDLCQWKFLYLSTSMIRMS